MRTAAVALLILVIYGATAASIWVMVVQTLVLEPTADSYSWQSVPLANNGGSDNFEITSYNQPPYNMRGWIAFNVSEIPENVWVMSATLNLRLWHKTTDNPPLGDPTGRVYGVYRLMGPWDEYGINWVNQPGWTDYHSATALVPSGQGGWYGPIIWMQWDITDIVRDWLTGAPNYGLVVKDTQENASLLYSTQFFTHDRVPNRSYYPRLIVTYLYPDAVYSAVAILLAETVLIGALLIRWRRSTPHTQLHDLNESNK